MLVKMARAPGPSGRLPDPAPLRRQEATYLGARGRSHRPGGHPKGAWGRTYGGPGSRPSARGFDHRPRRPLGRDRPHCPAKSVRKDPLWRGRVGAVHHVGASRAPRRIGRSGRRDPQGRQRLESRSGDPHPGSGSWRAEPHPRTAVRKSGPVGSPTGDVPNGVTVGRRCGDDQAGRVGAPAAGQRRSTGCGHGGGGKKRRCGGGGRAEVRRVRPPGPRAAARCPTAAGFWRGHGGDRPVDRLPSPHDQSPSVRAGRAH